MGLDLVIRAQTFESTIRMSNTFFEILDHFGSQAEGDFSRWVARWM